ncbi:hypothetical protein [Glycomyces tritici]|uniref:Uncharacterized protein n=1 Tax=Glycomyces tritici TaxID=2665176 RepID=A0ABT7YJ45_9ACTN|nr:hypothetical protein [Glycomyces tritici]MDN3238293.1 hypothetical protein [Glycomyces tritici]
MRRIVQRLLLAVALAVSAVLFVPAPAQAGPVFTICPYMGLPEDCYTWEIPILEPEGWPPGGCPECLLAIDIWDDFVDPVVFEQFNESFGKGFTLLAQSRLEQDPKAAKAMREASVGYFWDAAKATGKYRAELDHVGWFDAKAGKFFEDPGTQQRLDTFGKELAAGVQAFHKALGDPQPEPNIEAALAHFDAALNAASKY